MAFTFGLDGVNTIKIDSNRYLYKLLLRGRESAINEGQ
jgi:hypothetical protein